MTRARCSRAACLRTQLVPRVLLAGRQGGAAWRRDRQIVKQLGRRAAALLTACTPCAHRAHRVYTARGCRLTRICVLLRVRVGARGR